MTTFVIHHCKNTRLAEDHKDFCNQAWMDKDLTDARNVPPTWKYCKSCEAKDFINPDKPPISKRGINGRNNLQKHRANNQFSRTK